MKDSDKSDEIGWDGNDILMFLFFGMILGMLFLSLTFFVFGDDVDMVSVKKMGESLCESKGLIYSHRTMEANVPKIYCKSNTTERKLIDDIVFMEN